MTDAEKKKLLDGFRQSDQDEDGIDDPWTEEDILEAAKRIMERMNIKGEL